MSNNNDEPLDLPTSATDGQAGDEAQVTVAVAPDSAHRAQLIREFMSFRRKRDAMFPHLSGGDATWIVLLELYLAHIEQRSESISSLCVASGAPSTTALRYIRAMTDDGLLIRADDPDDGRRVFVALSPAGLARMEKLFDGLVRRLKSA